MNHRTSKGRSRQDVRDVRDVSPASLRYFIYCRKSSDDEGRQIMSLPVQNRELDRRFGDQNYTVVSTLEESRSAKTPGRPIFDDMLDRIEAGEADGIICWHPDRLARNSMDGGRIIYMLDRGVLLDIKFATYTFENNTQGKFMLQVAFAQSKHYSDNLGDVISRHIRDKVAQGWMPAAAPLGYKNCSDTQTIIPDAKRFRLVRRMFDLMLTGAYSPAEIVRIADEEWGLRTAPRKERPSRKRALGNRPVGLSSFYKTLLNPFYTGRFLWKGRIYQGKHKPMITLEEHQRIQVLFGRPGKERPHRHRFAFTGMMRCGSCALRITAEHKTNRFGTRYLYYHCTKRMIGPRCPESAVQVGALEAQIGAFLRTLSLPPGIEPLIFKLRAFSETDTRERHAAQKRSIESALSANKRQADELPALRVRGVFNDEDFLNERTRLANERRTLEASLATCMNGTDRFEPAGDLAMFSIYATAWFSAAEDPQKRLILETAGSNPVLTAKKLSVCARKPFVTLGKLESILLRRGLGEDVHTLKTLDKATMRKAMRIISDAVDDPECAVILHNIRLLRKHFAPASVDVLPPEAPERIPPIPHRARRAA